MLRRRLSAWACALLLSIAALPGADNGGAVFQPGPASSYANRQTISKLTIAAEVFDTPAETRGAFGKLDLAKYGVLPVLVVMENGSGGTLRLERMRVEYLRQDRRSLEAIPAAEVKYLQGPEKPQTNPRPFPNPIPGLGGKNKKPLAAFEIESRAFAARMLPPGDSASGFFYFNTASLRGSALYVTGIVEAAGGQELFYFEIPLD